MATNSYQLAGRMAKAQKLAALLLANGYTSGKVAGFAEEHWGYVIAAARIKSGKASQECRDMVIKILRQQEEANRASRRTVEDVDKLFERVGGR